MPQWGINNSGNPDAGPDNPLCGASAYVNSYRSLRRMIWAV